MSDAKEEYDRRQAKRAEYEKNAEVLALAMISAATAIIEGRAMVQIETGQDAKGNRHTEIRFKRDAP